VSARVQHTIRVESYVVERALPSDRSSPKSTEHVNFDSNVVPRGAALAVPLAAHAREESR